MNVTARKATIYKFEFSREELLAAGGLESEQLDYMEGTARRYLRKEGLPNIPNIGDGLSWWFLFHERPSTLTLVI